VSYESYEPPRGGAPDDSVNVNAVRLWSGGAATAGVAALVAVIGVLIARDILGFDLYGPALLLSVSGSIGTDYVITAAALALAGTGLAHALAVTTPRPQAFFSWIVGLLTLAAVVVPFARDAVLASQISVATINLVIGLSIGSLLSTVLSRTVFDSDGSWQYRR
jgi:hypothetical protein